MARSSFVKVVVSTIVFIQRPRPVYGNSWRDPNVFLQKHADLWDVIQVADAQHEEKLTMSLPLTLLMALHVFPDLQHKTESLTVHVVSMSPQLEGKSNWEIMWQARPPVLRRLSIDIINADVADTELNQACRPSTVAGLEIRCIKGWYPDVVQDFMLEFPDLVFISSPGIPRMEYHTWDPAIRWLLSRNVMTIFSHMYWVHQEVPMVSRVADLKVMPSSVLLQHGGSSYRGECEQFMFTTVTLRAYAASLGTTTQGWTIMQNPFAVEYRQGPDYDNAQICADSIALNRALLFVGNFGTIDSTDTHSNLRVEDMNASQTHVYDFAAWTIAAELLHHMDGKPAVRKLVRDVGGEGGGAPGWMQRFCAEADLNQILHRMLC
eukprot:TRINITY_DN42394_c0_g1_i1.p1 TRINITY_DN42394_c0_g1~~TRINITY_DN42394_c0_g1_i1.p1  ORF type:complete len:378 (+),score=53.55 TRINITY_DN42394_c0_g1_i1:116-1249(+)